VAVGVFVGDIVAFWVGKFETSRSLSDGVFLRGTAVGEDEIV
jgi:hypothetical protein